MKAFKMQFSIMFATGNISQILQVKRKDRLLVVSRAQFFPLWVFVSFNIQHRHMQIRQVMVELSINIPFTINAEKVKPFK